MNAPSYFVWGAFVSLCILYAVLAKRRGEIASRGNLPLPPGPRPLPLFGNLFDMPRKREWETITDWGQRYGEHMLFIRVPELNLC